MQPTTEGDAATYLVFGRTEFEQPLTHQGAVSGGDADAAATAARRDFGDSWVELSLIPADAVRWISGPDPGEDSPPLRAGGTDSPS